MVESVELISLLNERQSQIRKACQTIWSANQEIYIADSEWAVMEHVMHGYTMIAEVAKQIDISRQGIYKIVKSLEEKGLVEIDAAQNYRKRKCITLTPSGIRCYDKQQAIKRSLLDKIKLAIGTDNAEQLITILSMDWNMNIAEQNHL